MDVRRLIISLATAMVFLLPACPALASEKEERSSLQRLRGVEIVIEPLEPELEEGGLTTDQIRTDVELRLRTAGIEVSAFAEVDPKADISAILRVHIHIIEGGRYGFSYIYHVYVECLAAVFSKQTPNIESLAPIWAKSLLGAANEVRKIRSGTKDVVDIFLSDYLAVNPR